MIYTGILQKAYPNELLRIGMIDKSEYNKISAYIYYTSAFVYYEAGKGFVIDTPEITITYDTKEELMQDISYNLECIKIAYEDRAADERPAIG